MHKQRQWFLINVLGTVHGSYLFDMVTCLVTFTFFLLWHQPLSVCIALCDSRNIKQCMIISAFIHPLYKFLSAADHTGLLIPVSKGKAEKVGDLKCRPKRSVLQIIVDGKYIPICET